MSRVLRPPRRSHGRALAQPQVWPAPGLASSPQEVLILVRPSPGEPQPPLKWREDGHSVGLPVVAAAAGRGPTLGCGTACFSPIPERERLCCRAPYLPLRQAPSRVVLTVTAGKVTRVAHRT